MPGRVAGLSRATRCGLLLRDTMTLEAWHGQPERKDLRGHSSPRCLYCGRCVLARQQVGTSWRGKAAATMDHVDPEGETWAGNLVVACWSCNCAKGRRHALEYMPISYERILAALARPLDLRAGRLMARELYPRPTPRQELTDADRQFSVHAEEAAWL